MKLSDFILLSTEQKAYAILHQGILVAKRRQQQRIAFLFQMEHFYVETCCNPENKEIESFTAFEDMNFLNPYLETIPIGNLLE